MQTLWFNLAYFRRLSWVPEEQASSAICERWSNLEEETKFDLALYSVSTSRKRPRQGRDSSASTAPATVMLEALPARESIHHASPTAAGRGTGLGAAWAPNYSAYSQFSPLAHNG